MVILIGSIANVVRSTAATEYLVAKSPGLQIVLASGITNPGFGLRTSELRIIKSIEDAKKLEGEEVGLSDWVVIDQHRIDQFAEATGDHQWIHVDTERATREMPDGKTISHGYLTIALIPSLTGNFIEVENLARAINFGLNKVRFYAPVPVGARLRARATVLQARRRAGALILTSEVRLEMEGARKPACVAETLGMYFFDE